MVRLGWPGRVGQGAGYTASVHAEDCDPGGGAHPAAELQEEGHCPSCPAQEESFERARLLSKRVKWMCSPKFNADGSTSSAAAADLRGATCAEVEAAREAQAREHRAKEAARETRFGVGPSLDRIRMAELDVEKSP